MTPVLDARALSKRYGDLVVTNDVSLTLATGARHALIGPNGAGKSTLVHQLSGVVRPDGGQIFLAGEDITFLSAHRRVALGLGRTFQVTNLFQGLSVMHNIFMALSEREGMSGSMLRPAAAHRALVAEGEQIAEALGLADQLSHRVSEIAYGEQRLVEIALAMALRPKVLLLDEPAAGIPKGEVSRILEALSQLPAETTIMLIEHDMLVVREFAATVSVLVEGSIVMTGTPAEVLASDRIRDVYLGRGNRTERAVGHPRG